MLFCIVIREITLIKCHLRIYSGCFFLSRLVFVTYRNMAAQAVREETTDETEAKMAAERFDYIRLTFSDMHGIARSKTIARRNFPHFFANGTTIIAG